MRHYLPSGQVIEHRAARVTDPARVGRYLRAARPTADLRDVGAPFARLEETDGRARIEKVHIDHKRRTILPAAAEDFCNLCVEGGCSASGGDLPCSEMATLAAGYLGDPCACDCYPTFLRSALRIQYPHKICPTHGETCILSRCGVCSDDVTIVWYCREISKEAHTHA